MTIADLIQTLREDGAALAMFMRRLGDVTVIYNAEVRGTVGPAMSHGGPVVIVNNVFFPLTNPDHMTRSRGQAKVNRIPLCNNPDHMTRSMRQATIARIRG